MEMQQQGMENFYYVKQAVKTLKSYWYLFVTSIISCVGAAVFLNWYLVPEYEVSTLILVAQNEVRNNTPSASQEFMKSFSIFSSSSDVQSEILKMKSSELVYAALKKTKAEVSFYSKKGIRERELYNDCPFHVEFADKHVQPIGIRFHITPKSGNNFFLEVNPNEDQVRLYNYSLNQVVGAVNAFSFNQEFTYGDTIKSDYYSFWVLADKEKLGFLNPKTKLYFEFNDMTALTYSYQNQITIEQVAKEIQAASVKLKIENPQMGIDLINALTDAYLKRNIAKKNIVAESTIRFFDDQLSLIEDSLKKTERNLQSFQSSNRVMEISTKADQVYKGSTDLENQKAEMEAKDKYYNYVKDNLETNQNGTILVPSSMGVNDNVLGGMIDEFIKLNQERNNLLHNKQSQSPYFNNLTIKINNQRNALLENIKLSINTNQIMLNSVEERLHKANSQLSTLPGEQRKLVNIERKYRLNDNIYTYMLEKKAEAQVAKASNLPDNDILERAKLTQLEPVFPKKAINVAAGLFIGLIIPFFGFGMKAMFKDSITDDHSVQSLTKLPSIGRIYRGKAGKKQSPVVMIDSSRSAVAESIRTVRTNIQYQLKGKSHQVILLTSSISGEGKSFSSLNIAVSLSLLGSKTVLLDFDLRKPNTYDFFKGANDLGVSSILTGKAGLDDIHVPTGIDNFDFIPAGPVPTNPSELIDSEATASLIEQMKQRYEYVVIDTPPVGLVTEAFLLMQHADLKIFVIRENVTPRKQVAPLLKEIENKNIENVCWLMNDVDTKDVYYGKNSYYHD